MLVPSHSLNRRLPDDRFDWIIIRGKGAYRVLSVAQPEAGTGQQPTGDVTRYLISDRAEHQHLALVEKPALEFIDG